MQRQFEPTHDPRRRERGRDALSGPGALGPVRVLVTFPKVTRRVVGPAAPRRSTRCQEMAKAPNVVMVQPPVFADDGNSALLSAILSVIRGHGRA